MPRLTITLSEDRHRALMEAAARRRKSIAASIEESLEFYGILSITLAHPPHFDTAQYAGAHALLHALVKATEVALAKPQRVTSFFNNYRL